MKKILNFFFLLIAFQGFSQTISLFFINPKTSGATNPRNIIDVDVIYNKPTKVTLRLSFNDSMGQSDIYSWMIFDRNNGTIGNVNHTQIKNSNGSFNSHGSWTREITFTINNNENKKSTRQLLFDYRGNGSQVRYTGNHKLFINVNNLPDPNAPNKPTNPNTTDSPIPLCSDNTKYSYNQQTLKDRIMDHARPNVFYESVIITNSKIAARRVTIKGESRIHPNTTISSKSCREEKSLQIIENNVFESAFFENKIIKNQLSISPNPTSGQIQINSEVDINDWYVYDINAKIVLSGNNKNKNFLKISLDHLSAGIYYFKFFDSIGSLNEKTIIKK